MTDFDLSLRALEGDTRDRKDTAIDVAVRALGDIAVENVWPNGYRARANRAIADIATLLGKDELTEPIEKFLSQHHSPKLVIVPQALQDAINAKLDAAIASVPDAATDREIFYGQLLAFFDDYGYVPDFKLAERK